MALFLVQGSCKEYDEDEWAWVAWAFADEASAMQHCIALNKLYRELAESASHDELYDADATIWEPIKKLDKQFCGGFANIGYSVVKILAPDNII